MDNQKKNFLLQTIFSMEIRFYLWDKMDIIILKISLKE